MELKKSLKLVSGIVFIIFAMIAIGKSGFAVIVFLFASITCIPNSLEFIENKFKQKFSQKLKYIIVLFCLISGVLAIRNEEVTTIKDVNKYNEKKMPLYKIDLDAEVKQNPKSFLEIEVVSWENGGFGTVGIYNLNIKNTSKLPIQDIIIKFTYFGESGTVLNTNEATIYKIIKPKSTLKERNFNAGFKHSQGVTSKVEIIGATARVLYN